MASSGLFSTGPENFAKTPLNSLNREIAHLTTVFQRNGYLRFMIRKVLRTTVDSSNADSTDPKATISIPSVKGFSERINSYVLKWELECVLRPTEPLDPS